MSKSNELDVPVPKKSKSFSNLHDRLFKSPSRKQKSTDLLSVEEPFVYREANSSSNTISSLFSRPFLKRNQSSTGSTSTRPSVDGFSPGGSYPSTAFTSPRNSISESGHARTDTVADPKKTLKTTALLREFLAKTVLPVRKLKEGRDNGDAGILTRRVERSGFRRMISDDGKALAELMKDDRLLGRMNAMFLSVGSIEDTISFGRGDLSSLPGDLQEKTRNITGSAKDLLEKPISVASGTMPLNEWLKKDLLKSRKAVGKNTKEDIEQVLTDFRTLVGEIEKLGESVDVSFSSNLTESDIVAQVRKLTREVKVIEKNSTFTPKIRADNLLDELSAAISQLGKAQAEITNINDMLDQSDPENMKADFKVLSGKTGGGPLRLLSTGLQGIATSVTRSGIPLGSLPIELQNVIESSNRLLNKDVGGHPLLDWGNSGFLSRHDASIDKAKVDFKEVFEALPALVEAVTIAHGKLKTDGQKNSQSPPVDELLLDKLGIPSHGLVDEPGPFQLNVQEPSPRPSTDNPVNEPPPSIDQMFSASRLVESLKTIASLRPAGDEITTSMSQVTQGVPQEHDDQLQLSLTANDEFVAQGRELTEPETRALKQLNDEYQMFKKQQKRSSVVRQPAQPSKGNIEKIFLESAISRFQEQALGMFRSMVQKDDLKRQVQIPAQNTEAVGPNVTAVQPNNNPSILPGSSESKRSSGLKPLILTPSSIESNVEETGALGSIQRTGLRPFKLRTPSSATIAEGNIGDRPRPNSTPNSATIKVATTEENLPSNDSRLQPKQIKAIADEGVIAFAEHHKLIRSDRKLNMRNGAELEYAQNDTHIAHGSVIALIDGPGNDNSEYKDALILEHEKDLKQAPQQAYGQVKIVTGKQQQDAGLSPLKQNELVRDLRIGTKQEHIKGEEKTPQTKRTSWTP